MSLRFLKTEKREAEPEIELKKPINVFDFLNAINTKENYEICEIEEFDNIYNQFIINRALSQFPETLPYVDILTRTYLTNEMHFDFLWYAVPKKKRFGQWVKPEPFEKDIEAIQRAYNVSYKKAMEYKKLLSEEQIEFIMTTYPDETTKKEKKRV